MAGMQVVSHGDFVALAVLTAIAVAAVIYAMVGSRFISRRPSEPERHEQR